MRNKRNAAIIKDTLRKNLNGIILFVFMSVINLFVFFLYNIVLEPFIYCTVLSLVILLFLIIIDFCKIKKRSDERSRIIKVEDSNLNLSKSNSLLEEDYQMMINSLLIKNNELKVANLKERKDQEDYYSSWVHQIKTPIAVIKLQLDDSVVSKKISSELFRIEQYVEMVLLYVRLGATQNDLMVEEYDLDEIIKEIIRKYAKQFILRKLNLDFKPSGVKIVIDKKWFSVIVEQFISNAIKYTNEGFVKIYFDEDSRLVIEDSGIGIASEDLPRIFEKGFTGINGRLNKQSSGLGLYLAKSAADKLSVPISCNSKEGRGTKFYIDLKNKLVL